MSVPDRLLSRRDVLRCGAVGGAAIAAGSVPGVSSAARSRVAAASPTKGGTLKFGRSIAPTTLDPANPIIAGDIYTLDKIFEPLFITNPKGELTPWLASSYKLSNGNKTVTFPLRPGVKFSNGKPLTAADVVFSINRSRHNAAGPLSFLDGAITSIG